MPLVIWKEMVPYGSYTTLKWKWEGSPQCVCVLVGVNAVCTNCNILLLHVPQYCFEINASTKKLSQKLPNGMIGHQTALGPHHSLCSICKSPSRKYYPFVSDCNYSMFDCNYNDPYWVLQLICNIPSQSISSYNGKLIFLLCPMYMVASNLQQYKTLCTNTRSVFTKELQSDTINAASVKKWSKHKRLFIVSILLCLVCIWTPKGLILV